MKEKCGPSFYSPKNSWWKFRDNKNNLIAKIRSTSGNSDSVLNFSYVSVVDTQIFYVYLKVIYKN